MFSGGAIFMLSLLGTPVFSSPLLKRDVLPDYALTFAPLSHLYSGESWWPSDVTTHLEHVTPEVDFVAVTSSVTLESLDALASVPSDTYLTSNDVVDDEPQNDWLLSTENIPDSTGLSAAPATIIAVEKDGGIVDAFYFYFYSFNEGNTVLDIRFGDHVGDWEHSMVRFINGTPAYVYISAHSGGSGYTYDAVEQSGGRPVTYIAKGTHANYATAGVQDYGAPFGLLSDTTDAGPIWDVTLNYRGYWYDNSTSVFTIAGGAGTGASELASETVDWLSWLGQWGDEQYSDGTDGQYCIFGECLFESGPTGPLAKNLGRTAICQDEDDCDIQDSVATIKLENTTSISKEELDQMLADQGVQV